MTDRTLGWLGTGRMGAAMSRRLVDAGKNVTVWNRTRSKTDDPPAAGAKVADTIADLSAADIAFIIVTSPDLSLVLI